MILFMTELNVRDVAVSLAWYQGILGMRIVLRDEPAGFVLLESQGRLALKQHAELPSVSGVILHFQVPNLDECMNNLQQRNIALAAPPKLSHEGYRRILLHDPDGYSVCVFEWCQPVPN
jgi:catechol 2,3-dioxygenase-like lactoylglutathione lyase family enzyme